MIRRRALSNSEQAKVFEQRLGARKKGGGADDHRANVLGELSEYLKVALAETDGEATYVLVDRKTVRNKVCLRVINIAPS